MFRYANAPTGHYYECLWNNDTKKRTGVHRWSNGSRYAGLWLNNYIHGDGILTLVNGTKYVGTFKNSQKHGKGKLTLAKSGNRYTGDFDMIRLPVLDVWHTL